MRESPFLYYGELRLFLWIPRLSFPVFHRPITIHKISYTVRPSS